MTLGIFTTVSHGRGDLFAESMKCYSELADVVVVVDGSGSIYKKVNDEYLFYTNSPVWEQEFSWEFIGQQFQRGYEALDTDFVIHCDLDFIFHEQDFEAIRQACIEHNDQPAFSMLKRQFILPDRFNVKSRLVVAVNKGRFGEAIRFDSGGDLAQPSFDGKYIEPGTVPDVKIPFYNYEKLLKTKDQIAEDQGRMERAWFRHFGYHQMGSDGTNEGAYEKWMEAQRGKFNKSQETISLGDHPKYVQETIKALKPEQFGYNGFGLMEGKAYAD